MSHQMENISEEVEVIKKNQIKILELKSIIGMKISLEGFHSRFELPEESANLMTDK